ncbi:alpha/beta hydrolase [Variovorax sp. WS11]|uniref:YheT family hydrolase n=1 Tax=Variovorax sp. WS11 TaxID=1105204 RepID=UPI000D0DAED5|nr:alpha/beta fold hydrolase [Variovorax sp. WS11]NDZ14223.1 alpha/beta fold hydrolase [Variovorax sp. WS11]PSL81223.1 alpha/beta hydrolase [Variovorax sp. WS11]
MQYVAPRWLPGGNLQTIWPALWARRVEAPLPAYLRERWNTPDGDFIDVDFLAAEGPAPKPLLVLFHGLEGSSKSHYAEAFAAHAQSRSWDYAVPHFRGCSGEINLAPRAYHSGDFEEVGWILSRLRERHAGPMLVAGVSLGGNALLRWVEEAGAEASKVVSAAASISAPLDLAAGGAAIGQGFNRLVYTRMFLASMKPKALAKLAQHPGLFDREALLAAADLHAFDNVFTAPLHGFRDTDDYWRRASAKPHLDAIRIPALVVNATNDPFVPAASLPRPEEAGRHVTLWQPAHGGHVGFPMGRPPGHVLGMPERVGDWLAQHL